MSNDEQITPSFSYIMDLAIIFHSVKSPASHASWINSKIIFFLFLRPGYIFWKSTFYFYFDRKSSHETFRVFSLNSQSCNIKMKGAYVCSWALKELVVLVLLVSILSIWLIRKESLFYWKLEIGDDNLIIHLLTLSSYLHGCVWERMENVPSRCVCLGSRQRTWACLSHVNIDQRRHSTYNSQKLTLRDRET